MEFERLESSIELNREEEPSIFMALCMVESLFRDIRDVSGRDISENPLGDEMLPVRLAWLDRVVHNIYTRNRAEFVRGLDRVDKMEAMLQAERAELGQAAAAAKTIKEKEAEAEVLTAQLTAAREAQQTWNRLTQECAEKRGELQKLQAVDPAQAQTELEGLTAQVEALQQQQQGILDKQAALRSKLQELTNQQTSAAEEEKELLKQQTEQTGALEQQKAKNQRLAEELRAQKAELDRLQAECTPLQAQAAQAQAQTEAFRAQQIAPQQTALQAAQQAVQEQQNQLRQLNEQLERAKAERNQGTCRVAELTAELAQTEQEVRDKQQQLEQQNRALAAEKATKDQLTGQYNGRMDTLSALQKETQKLRDDLKKSESFITAARAEKTALLNAWKDQQMEHQQKLATLEQNIQDLTRDNESLSQKVKEQEQERQQLDTAYQGLTAKQSANDAEINNLEQRLQELQGKTDEEKNQRIKLQLKEAIETVERCRQEGEEAEKQLEELNGERNRLQEARKKQDDALQGLKDMLEMLQPFNTLQYKERLSRLLYQNQVLENARKHLVDSINEICEARGSHGESTPEADPAGSLDELLKELQQAEEELRKQLLVCADSVQLNEMV